MSFMDRLKALFSRATTPASSAVPEAGLAERRFIKDRETGLLVETDDEMMAAGIGQAFKTDLPVIGNRQPDGNFKLTTLNPKGTTAADPKGPR